MPFCDEFGECRSREEWVTGRFRDSNGISLPGGILGQTEGQFGLLSGQPGVGFGEYGVGSGQLCKIEYKPTAKLT